MPNGNDVVTLPQHFKQHGINTTGSGKVFHCGTSSGGPTKNEGGFDQQYSWSQPYWGCDQFYNGTFQSLAAQQWPGDVAGCVQTQECHECLKAHGSEGAAIKPSWVGAPCDATCYPDGAVAANAVKQLQEAAEARKSKPDKPFFIAAGFKRPHLGWFAPQEWFDRYPNASIALAKHRHPPPGMPSMAWSGNGEIKGMDDVHPVMSNSSGFDLVPDWKQFELRRAYYAAVSFMDSQLGLVLDALENTGLRNSTAITFVGDHGYQCK